jgi:hypothetical protein
VRTTDACDDVRAKLCACSVLCVADSSSLKAPSSIGSAREYYYEDRCKRRLWRRRQQQGQTRLAGWEEGHKQASARAGDAPGPSHAGSTVLPFVRRQCRPSPSTRPRPMPTMSTIQSNASRSNSFKSSSPPGPTMVRTPPHLFRSHRVSHPRATRVFQQTCYPF